MQEVQLVMLLPTAAICTYISDDQTTPVRQTGIELFAINGAIILRYFNRNIN
jgi:hypothetical protein